MLWWWCCCSLTTSPSLHAFTGDFFISDWLFFQPLETTSVAGFSPVPVTQLVHGSICTDHDDVDSFVDIFDQDLSNVSVHFGREILVGCFGSEAMSFM